MAWIERISGNLLTIAEALAEAEAAYHKLLVGQAVVEFRDSNGETVRYQAANVARLAAYIADLKRQLGTTVLGPMQTFL